MKALLSAFSMIVSGFALGAGGLAHAGAPNACAAAPAASAGGYPNFCAIPQPPRDVRTATQFKTAAARTQAVAPPPMTPPSNDTLDFARRAREEATPPPKPH
jgi:hypothetical protein